MMTITDLRTLHDQALDDATTYVLACGADDLGRPTPCHEWNLAALLGHMIGQNSGFAAAVGDGDAPTAGYAGPAVTGDTLLPWWHSSVDRLRAAFAEAPADRPVRLAELDLTVPAEMALRMHILDTAVHAWDVAEALGRSYRPGTETVALVEALAREVAARDTSPSFAAPLDLVGDPWRDALRLLGRRA